MTPAQIEAAQKLLRRREDLRYAINARSQMHRAYVTVNFPRNGPGNDRDERTVEISIDEAIPHLRAALEALDHELAALGVEMPG